MEKYNLIIGSHVKMSKVNDYLLGALKETIDYKANTFMIYTGAPQNTKRVETLCFKIEEFKNDLKKNDLKIKNLIIHAPYIINLANTIKPYVYKLATDFLEKEIQRAEDIGIPIVVLHPGSAVGADRKIALDQIIKGLNKVLKPNQKVKIALETMAGKGSELGIDFNELKYIIDNVELNEKIGVCWDTCHMSDAGYDLENDLDKIIEEFDNKIGLKNLLVMHINDSKNPRWAHRDRHANIGFGYIGFKTLIKIIYHPKFNNIVKILETPHVNKIPVYKEEIQMIRNKKFVNFLNWEIIKK